MPEKTETEHRVKFRTTDCPDQHTEPTTDAAKAGRQFREMRENIGRIGVGGEVEIQTRQTTPWTGAREKVVIPAKPGSAPATIATSVNSLMIIDCFFFN